MRFVQKIFPLLDHLYIFQNLEYESWAFSKWSLRNFFKRGLQRKHKVELTFKAVLLFIISLFLLIKDSLIIGWWLGNLTFAPLVFLVLAQFSPVFLIFSQLVLWPFESYKKYKIIQTAKFKRSKLKGLEVVAVVGSFAKTSTKDILYTLLWRDFRVVKTPKSYNTLVSVARTMLADLKDNTQIFICEMDAYHPGEIKELCKLARPTLGIITSIAPQHLERFGSMEKLAGTQFEVAEFIPEDGVLFLNSGDKEIMQLEDQYTLNKCFYGLGESDNYRATNIAQTVAGVEFRLHTPNGSIDIQFPLYGEHHVINFLAAASIANQLGLSLKTIQKRAKLLLQTPHRLEVNTQGNLTIIDNSYNSNPVSVKASLKLLKDFPGDKKILITPGFIELGKTAFQENEEFGRRAGEVADEVIIVGVNSRRALLKGLEGVSYPKDKIHQVISTGDGMNLLSQLTVGKTVVLIENDLPDQYF